MNLNTLKATLLDFAINPCKSWGQTYGNVDFLAATQARVPIEQADRNTARLRSGSYTPEQLESFERQCELVESYGGTAVFLDFTPDSLEFSHACKDCDKPFASCKAEARRCFDCELKALCPLLPWRTVNHHWFYNDHEWTMQVFGDIGWRNELTFWWHNSNTGSNVGHQGLVTKRDADGNILKLDFRTVAMNAAKRYSIVWDIHAGTTGFFINPTTSVNDDRCGPTTQVDEFNPMVMDLVLAMTPTWMLYKHRPRNPANDCFM